MWGEVAGAVVGGLASAWSTHQTNKAQKALADKQMDFQEDMSNTAHQREVKDLRAAGLNPILSAGGQGASAPVGAMANLEAPDVGDALEQGVSTAIEKRRLQKEIDAVDSQVLLNKQAAKTQKAQEKLNINSARVANANAKKVNAEASITRAQVPVAKDKAKYDKTQIMYNRKAQTYDNITDRILRWVPFLNTTSNARKGKGKK